jgi:probable addiction module antidote protein
MSTVFIGGSRHVSRLPPQAKERLNNVMRSGHQIVVGDANGADKAVQKHLSEARYEAVTVFCSGESPRNNLGHWPTHNVLPPKSARGFQFHAAKDREMARKADFGLMIWDGKSVGTVLNVLRLVRAGKIAVLMNVSDKTMINIKSTSQWEELLANVSPSLIADLRDRAMPDEWMPLDSQRSFFERPLDAQPSLSDDEMAVAVNVALASGDPASVLDALGSVARARGMTNVAKETGLARESLYRSLGRGGNPEFATVLKVIEALGLRLEVSKARADQARAE